MNAIITTISGLLARIRARLRSWLQPADQGRPEPAALPVSMASPAAPIAAASAASAASLSEISAASASAVSASVPSASVPSASTASASVASASVASVSVASASVASASVDSASMVSEISAASLSLAREAANSPVRSPVAVHSAAPAALAVPDDGRVGVQVRQFFARMASAGPGGLVVDFAAWGPVPVERFFMALGAAERGERRGPALADASSIGEAFQGFVWD